MRDKGEAIVLRTEPLAVRIVTDDEKLIPRYHSTRAGGCDLRANIANELTIGIQEWKCVPTGIRVEIPEGFEGQVRARSGLALRHGITLLNAPGTIDADYRDEISVILINLGKSPYTLRRYDRIAQLVIARFTQSKFIPVEDLEVTDRRGGFGSTGME